jgi:hypothetical protein
MSAIHGSYTTNKNVNKGYKGFCLRVYFSQRAAFENQVIQDRLAQVNSTANNEQVAELFAPRLLERRLV